MTDSLSLFERHVLAKVTAHPGITAKDLALRLGMGVLPVLAILSSLRARGFVARHVDWQSGVLPARWSAVEVGEL